MKVKLKVSEVVVANLILPKLTRQDLSTGLASWAMYKNREAISREFQAYEETRVTLVRTKYGTESPEEPGHFEVLADKSDEFKEAMKPIAESEVEIEVQLLSISTIPSITPDEIALLKWMFIENYDTAGTPAPQKPPRQKHPSKKKE